jgi:hypothetical protein
MLGAPVMRHVARLAVCWLVSAVAASGQILLTGETGGSGAQAVTVTGNLISPKDFGRLSGFLAQYGYGLANHVDLFASYGSTTVYREMQHYVGVGSNVGILQRGRHGLDVSLLSNASVPVTRRHQAATALVTLAVIASRPVKLGSVTVAPYGGVKALAPVGARARGVFTSVGTQYAGIAGAAVPLHRIWSLYVECDRGPNLRSGGAGITVTLPPSGAQKP